MAYVDFASFRPSESAYTGPGEFEETQRNIALEKASYLSSMDQFYTDIEERGREFDLTLAFEKERQAFTEEAWQMEYEENIREFDIQAALRRKEIDLAKRQQSHGESMDWFGGGLDVLGGIDMIGSWFS